MTNKTFLISAIIMISSMTSYCQSILNGDFENNFALGDQINITNAQFDNLMMDSNAFGNWNGGGENGGNVDIITSASYCNSAAQQGSWYIALTGGGTDAISLKLSTPLNTGQTYTLSFYDRFGYPLALDVHPLQIGISPIDTTFGTLIYTAPNALNCKWSLRSFSFVAPNNGQFISVKISGGGPLNTWCHIDNFILEAVSPIQNLIQTIPQPSKTSIKNRRKMKKE